MTNQPAKPMDQRSSPVAPGLGAAEPVLSPAPGCLICGYDLGGLPPLGECPECGLAVRRTLARQAFPSGASAFVRGQAQAVRDLSLAIAILLVSMVAAVALLLMSRGWLWGVVFIAGTALAVLSWARGWRRLVVADPDASWDMHHRATKRVLRWLIVPGLVGPLLLVVAVGVYGTRTQPGWFNDGMIAIGLGSMAILGAQTLIGSRYLASMTRRLQNRSLARALVRQAYALMVIGLTCVLLGQLPSWLAIPGAWFALGLADSLRRLGLALSETVSDASGTASAATR